jgi:putative adhesin
MRRLLLRVATILMLTSVLAAPLLASEVTRTLRLEISPANGPFVVENLAGSMRIVPGSGTQVVAIATIQAESASLADKIQFRQVTGDKGLPTLRVEYPLGAHEILRYRQSSDSDHHGFLGDLFGGSTTTKYAGRSVKISSTEGTSMYADLEVQLPSKSLQATFRNLVGPIRGESVQGKLLFDSASGDITLDKLQGAIKADTGSGDVKASGLEGSFQCDTGSGNCDLAGFKGDDISCDVGSGDILLKSVSAKHLSANTGSGDVRVEDADVESFDADTGSGDVSLEAAGPRLVSIKADTGSGDVVLHLSPGASFEALADQGSGDLRMAYKDAQPIVKGREVIGYRRGDSKIRINVSTGSGDLEIAPLH